MIEYSEFNHETYDAFADAAKARVIGETQSPFHIEVRFLGGLTPSQKQVFKDAADRWTKIIVGDVPDVMVNSQSIDDVLIEAQGAFIYEPGRVLGQASNRPTVVLIDRESSPADERTWRSLLGCGWRRSSRGDQLVLPSTIAAGHANELRSPISPGLKGPGRSRTAD
jgi:hypothetical protein